MNTYTRDDVAAVVNKMHNNRLAMRAALADHVHAVRSGREDDTARTAADREAIDVEYWELRHKFDKMILARWTDE